MFIGSLKRLVLHMGGIRLFPAITDLRPAMTGRSFALGPSLLFNIVLLKIWHDPCP